MTATLETPAPLFHSADGHCNEPDDLFTTRLPKHLRPAAYRRECFERDGRYFAHTYLSLKSDQEAGYFLTAERMPGADGGPIGTGVEERLDALTVDGVGIEILNPGAFPMYWTPDAELAMAHARVYNDFAAEAYIPTTRVIPIAAVPLVDVGMAVAEIERVASLG